MAPSRKKRYQQYEERNMIRALHLIRGKRWSIRKSAKLCGVPLTSLHDKLSGRSELGTKQGAPTLFTAEEEKLFADHIKHLAEVGYPLGRRAFSRLATNSAGFLGKKRRGRRLLTDSWLSGFMGRWPELKLAKPQKLGMRRAHAMSREVIDRYFDELEDIIDKYSLANKPHLIYNMDETGFQTDHSPSKCIAPRNLTPLNLITTERGPLTTVLATGNAAGNCMPPFFVYKGKRMMEELKTGAYPGSRFHMTDSGWSNSEVFQDYLENHFLKFLPNREGDQHALLLYDGHSSHISIPLIEFAKSHNIILFVLPAHTSHALQPLDKGIFSPLKSHFHTECDRFMRENVGQVITRYNMTEIISRSYARSLSPANLMSAFRATGVFPTTRTVVNETFFAIARNLVGDRSSQRRLAESNQEELAAENLSAYLESQRPSADPGHRSSRKKRNYSYRPGGVAITEDKILLKIMKVAQEKEVGKKSKKSKQNSKDTTAQQTSSVGLNATSKSKKRRKKSKKSKHGSKHKKLKNADGTSGGDATANKERKSRKKSKKSKHRSKHKSSNEASTSRGNEGSGGKSKKSEQNSKHTNVNETSHEKATTSRGISEGFNNFDNMSLPETEDDNCCVCGKFSPPELRTILKDLKLNLFNGLNAVLALIGCI